MKEKKRKNTKLNYVKFKVKLREKINLKLLVVCASF